MSVENRPNLHAVGLLVDIQTALRQRLRGKAKQDENNAVSQVLQQISTFCDELSDHLDEIYGR
jgi:hypothetical protein